MAQRRREIERQAKQIVAKQKTDRIRFKQELEDQMQERAAAKVSASVRGNHECETSDSAESCNEDWPGRLPLACAIGKERGMGRYSGREGGENRGRRGGGERERRGGREEREGGGEGRGRGEREGEGERRRRERGKGEQERDIQTCFSNVADMSNGGLSLRQEEERRTSRMPAAPLIDHGDPSNDYKHERAEHYRQELDGQVMQKAFSRHLEKIMEATQDVSRIAVRSLPCLSPLAPSSSLAPSTLRPSVPSSLMTPPPHSAWTFLSPRAT